jgi:hypothetical protein
MVSAWSQNAANAAPDNKATAFSASPTGNQA